MSDYHKNTTFLVFDYRKSIFRTRTYHYEFLVVIKMDVFEKLDKIENDFQI